jgi:hypothetical protein
VEEARQHSSLNPDSFTPEEIGLAIVGGVGGLAVAVGVVSHFIVGGRSILLGILAFAVSRALMRIWQLARPNAFPRNRASPQMTIALVIFWLLLSFCLSVPFWVVR